MGRRLTTIEFINKSELVHNNKYDYTLVDYKNNKTKVMIVCKEHGIFYQLPINHINCECGCPNCFGNIKSTTIDFIEKAKNIHNDKYNYSDVLYINDKTKVKITCNKHGLFEQTPNVHLSGHGCYICGNRNDVLSFIERSKEIYGDDYDYSLVVYKNINTKVKIICKNHGEFMIKPSQFLYEKKGCIFCSKKIYKDISYLIVDANKIHGNKYKYEEISGVLKKDYINITCQLHGVFKQRISSHIYDKTGCPHCSESKGENIISKYLESNMIAFERQFKFDDCKNKNHLKFDFYLPKLKICIEYDGEQHFNIIEHFGGYDSLNRIKMNDNIKNNYCDLNDIKLIRIPYYEFEKIEDILKENLIK